MTYQVNICRHRLPYLSAMYATQDEAEGYADAVFEANDVNSVEVIDLDDTGNLYMGLVYRLQKAGRPRQ